MAKTGKALYGLPDGVGHELKFWKEFVKTPRFLHGWVGKGRTPELDANVAHFIATELEDKPDASVLDMGSGAVSILNGLVPSNQLTATDPLGELYECIFDYAHHHIDPPLPIAAELLGEPGCLQGYKFDIIHMRNALDHSQDPSLALKQMMKACKPGGFVIIQGFANEANAENWQGMHQWNINISEGCLLIQGKDSNGSTFLNAYCADQFPLNNKQWLLWIWQKPF